MDISHLIVPGSCELSRDIFKVLERAIIFLWGTLAFLHEVSISPRLGKRLDFRDKRHPEKDYEANRCRIFTGDSCFISRVIYSSVRLLRKSSEMLQ